MKKVRLKIAEENKIQKNKIDRRKDFFGKESEYKEKNKRVVNKKNCVEKQREKFKKKLFCMKFK